jgi:flagellar biosynthetic protein FliQ
MVLTVMRDAVSTVLFVSMPPALVGLVIGIIISIFQAATQVNEQTLTFIPKIVGILLSLLVFGGFMLNSLTEFAQRMFEYALTVPA